jgi:hypothetical protein
MCVPTVGFAVTGGDPVSLAGARTTFTEAGAEQRKEWGRVSGEIASSHGPVQWADTLLSGCQ